MLSAFAVKWCNGNSREVEVCKRADVDHCHLAAVFHNGMAVGLYAAGLAKAMVDHMSVKVIQREIFLTEQNEQLQSIASVISLCTVYVTAPQWHEPWCVFILTRYHFYFSRSNTLLAERRGLCYNPSMSKQMRQKRGDTLVKTIERKYGVDLGYRSDAQLHTVLKKEGLPSLSKLLKMTQKKSV